VVQQRQDRRFAFQIGAALILGGLKRLNYVNRTAEVPWLGRIPLIGDSLPAEGPRRREPRI
jgi:Flp pilus assembly secretin CpaC